MDPDIKDALADIKGDLKDGFAAVNARIDHLVTRAEFVAEVRRIDSEHGNLRGQHDSLRGEFSRHLDQTTELLEATRVADAAIDARSEQRTNTLSEKIARLTKWAIGLTLTGIIGATGIVLTLIQFIRTL